MRNWSLNSKIVLLTFIPTLLVSILLGSYFTIQRILDVNEQLNNLGSSIIQQLEPSSRIAFITKKNNILRLLANTAIEDPNIIAVAFYDATGNLAAYNGPEYLMSKDLQSFKQNTLNQKNNIGMLQTITADVPSQDYSTFYSPLTNENGSTLGTISVVINHAATSYMKMQSILVSIIIVFLGLIFGLILSRLISFLITRPLSKIQKAITSLQHSDFNYRLYTLPGHEFNKLAKDLNKLKTKLQQLENLQFDHTTQETSDLKQTLEKIEIQNIELNIALKNAQRDNRRKSEFIASLSHEIRTPMSSIIGFTNLLLESELNKYQQEYLVTIQKSANTLLAIINDILDFSKIEAGKFKLENIPFDFNDIIDEVLQSLAPEAQRKQLELIPLVSPDIPAKILGDPLRLKQILTNLVFNAIKFTEEGSICIKAEFLKQIDSNISLQISVIDTGIGLSDKDKKNLFKAFSQADASIARKFGGTGLGLVISQQFIEQMGGTIEIHSKIGVGTTMRFILNFTALNDANQTIRYLRKIDKSLLIYESHLLSRTAIRQCLSAWVHQLIIVDTFDLLKKQLTNLAELNELPDHIILSLGTTMMNDVHVIEILDFIKINYSIPITVIANSTHNTEINKFMQHGAANYILKPLSVKKIIAAIYELQDYQEPKPQPKLMTQEAAASYQRHKVLIAEDNPANLKLLCSIFNKLGIQPDTAIDGKLAVAQALKQKYDIIFLDLHMPMMSGIEVAEYIRLQSNLNQQTPIVAIGAYIDENEKHLLYDAGFNELLLKPVDLLTISQTIQKWLELIHENETSQLLESINNLPLVDLNKTIELSAGSETIAKEVIQMFMNELPTLTEKMHTFYRHQQWDKLIEVIHKINGSSRYCAMVSLQKTAEELEKALKNGSENKFNVLYEKISSDIIRLQEYMTNNPV